MLLYYRIYKTRCKKRDKMLDKPRILSLFLNSLISTKHEHLCKILYIFNSHKHNIFSTLSRRCLEKSTGKHYGTEQNMAVHHDKTYPGNQFRLPCTPPPGQFFMGAKLFIGTPWMGNKGVLKKNLVWAM